MEGSKFPVRELIHLNRDNSVLREGGGGGGGDAKSEFEYSELGGSGGDSF